MAALQQHPRGSDVRTFKTAVTRGYTRRRQTRLHMRELFGSRAREIIEPKMGSSTRPPAMAPAVGSAFPDS